MPVPPYAHNFNLRVDGVLIPPPSSYDFTESDLVENSHRNAQGYTVWDIVRQNVAQISAKWDNLDADRLKQVVSAIRSKKSFRITFFNPHTGKSETREFYAGDRATTLNRYIALSKYTGSLTIPFVEV